MGTLALCLREQNRRIKVRTCFVEGCGSERFSSSVSVHVFECSLWETGGPINVS